MEIVGVIIGTLMILLIALILMKTKEIKMKGYAIAGLFLIVLPHSIGIFSKWASRDMSIVFLIFVFIGILLFCNILPKKV